MLVPLSTPRSPRPQHICLCPLDFRKYGLSVCICPLIGREKFECCEECVSVLEDENQIAVGKSCAFTKDCAAERHQALRGPAHLRHL
ncbi:hypothetical protein GN244_ATG08503 [Phytophthora infestans]|uniref:Uncharacterized protein n=1 Tax=Phytophthora infestans TaxID=4787 RepID=A0A833SX51_PHYIN|nr:hypothetical protein GN244_ATG08503 [Phytophthora infestans]KAF4132361.1 hypothetical protein GN958_ATG18478 [Phytophthora infestans]